MYSAIYYQLSISFYYYNVQGKQGGRRTNQSQLTEGERREWWDDRRQEQLCKRTRCHIKFNTNKSITWQGRGEYLKFPEVTEALVFNNH